MPSADAPTLDLPVLAQEAAPGVDRPAGDVGGEAAKPAGRPRIIALDLSLTASGVAGDFGVDVIKSAGGRDDTLEQRSARLSRLRNKVRDWIANAQLVVIEGPSYNSQGSGTWDRAGLWWLVVRCCHANGIPVVAVPPASRCTYATGKGNASKDQVLAAAVKRYPTVEITGNNQADAYVLYALALDHYGHAPAAVPQTHRRALDNITWPELAP